MVAASLKKKQVSVNGTVAQPYSSKGNLFFTLESQKGSIKVADFDSKTAVNSSEKVSVTGRVTLYRGSLEIIAERIEK